MTAKLHNKLLALARRCEALAAEIRASFSEAQSETPPGKRTRKAAAPEIDAYIQDLKQSSRQDAQAKLASLPQATLAQILRALGGSSRDAKKPKDAIITQVLWELFDFSRGHEILKQ